MAHTSLIQFDRNLTQEEIADHSVQINLNFKDDEVQYAFCTTEDQFFNLVNSSVRSVIIMSGSLGQQLVPKLYSGLNEVPNIFAIIIFCLNVDYHK